MNDVRIKRFMKGVYKLRPPRPRYDLTWDPSVVLNYLGNMYPNEGLTFSELTKKLVTLLALVTAHRVQTLSLIRISEIKRYNDKCIITIPDFIKTSGVNKFQPTLLLPFFNERPSICPARTLNSYLDASKPLRGDNCDFLFLSLKKPHKKVSSQSLSRWIKVTLGESGVDFSIFGAHSTRHAATSAANRLGVNIDVIKKTAGWSGNSTAFAKFYNREVSTETQDAFARTLCQGTPVNYETD